MSLTLHSALVTDLGLIRQNNEDSAFAGSRLLAIADGVGGGPAGEDASALVIRGLRALETDDLGDDPAATLLQRLLGANDDIRQAAIADPAKDGMGTTVTTILLADPGSDTGGSVAVLHVGDSRAYLLRDGHLQPLTRDDTYVQSLVDSGLLSPEDARYHPQRSIITQSVQGMEFEAAQSLLPIQVSDRFLVCSDGLSDIVTDATIERAMAADLEPEECAELLVKLALQAGAPDNVTVIVADVVKVGTTPISPAVSTLVDPEPVPEPAAAANGNGENKGRFSFFASWLGIA
jgi:PPM family protein phosphatase